MSNSKKYNMTHMANSNTRQQHYLTTFNILYLQNLKFLWLYCPISSMKLPELYEMNFHFMRMRIYLCLQCPNLTSKYNVYCLILI